MTELLERWAALENDRCYYDDETGCYRVVIGSDSTGRTVTMRLHKPDEYALDRVAIQAAVQEAIRRQDWWFMLNRWERNGKEVYACVGIKPSEAGKRNAVYKNQWGHEEAETLLTAYLRALEPVAEGGEL